MKSNDFVTLTHFPNGCMEQESEISIRYDLIASISEFELNNIPCCIIKYGAHFVFVKGTRLEILSKLTNYLDDVST